MMEGPLNIVSLVHATSTTSFGVLFLILKLMPNIYKIKSQCPFWQFINTKKCIYCWTTHNNKYYENRVFELYLNINCFYIKPLLLLVLPTKVLLAKSTHLILLSYLPIRKNTGWNFCGNVNLGISLISEIEGKAVSALTPPSLSFLFLFLFHR